MEKIFFCGIFAVALLASATANAQLSLSQLFSVHTINFDGTVTGVSNGAFAGAGFQATPTTGQLDSDAWAMTGWSDGDLAFGGTRTTASTDYTRGTSPGAVTTGGVYAFDVDPSATVNRALGFQPGGGDWAPGTVTLKLVNNTGSVLSALDIAYTVYINNDQGRSSSFNFSYSADNATYTSVPSLDLTSPTTLDALGFVANQRSTTISGLNIAPGDSFYLRWSSADVSGSGSRDEFALDDISVTPVPEPSTYAAGILAVLVVCWTQRRRMAKLLPARAS
jgi:hypothetical protein